MQIGLPMSTRFPGRRFSVRRLFIFVAVVIALVCGTVLAVAYQVQAFKPLRTPWTGGYVDVTETPTFQLESRTGSGQKNLVLAFIVADDGTCSPSWGNYYTPDEANTDLDLDRRIAQFHKSGRTLMLSFGGAHNTDLARACSSAPELADAMGSVIDRYGARAIDLDIEGDALDDVASQKLRSDAVRILQERMSDRGETLAVWLTLPADRAGLTNRGVGVVQQALQSGVNLTGVNLMTMNFGVPSNQVSLADLSTQALQAAHGQITRTLLMSGRIATAPQVWGMLGATPMVGQNDEVDEVFTIEDAIALHSFAQANNLGRLSFWSLNRDQQCDSNYADWQTAVNFCSGIAQDTLEFDAILSSMRDGGADQVLADQVPALPQSSGTLSGADDPATSPYPVWSAQHNYVEGERVVWRHNVYVALWANRDYMPDAVDAQGQTAWRLVGPVLPGETPRELPTVPAGTFPAWDAQAIYDTPDRVEYEGVIYEAKWWTQADSPAASAGSDSSPWRPLTEAEIQEILGADRP